MMKDDDGGWRLILLNFEKKKEKMVYRIPKGYVGLICRFYLLLYIMIRCTNFVAESHE